MHNSKFTSFTILILACLMLNSVVGKNYDSVYNILTDMDIDIPEMEKELLNHEEQIFGTIRTYKDNGEEFFVSFSLGERMEEVRKTGPANREEFNKRIELLVQKYNAELKSNDFNKFIEEAKKVTENYLIYQYMIMDLEVNSEELILSFTQNIKRINKHTSLDKKGLGELFEEIKKLLESAKTSFKDSARALDETFKYKIDINWDDVCNAYPSEESQQRVFTILTNKLSLFYNYANKNDYNKIFRSFNEFVKSLVNSNGELNNGCAKLVEYALDIYEKLLSKTNANENIINVIMNRLILNSLAIYSQNNVEIMPNEALISLFDNKREELNLVLNNLINNEGTIANAALINLWEYLTEITITNIAINKDNLVDFKLGAKEYNFIKKNILVIINMTRGNLGLINQKYQVFKILEHMSLNNFYQEKLINFINLIIRVKDENPQGFRDQPLKAADELIENLYHKIADDKDIEFEAAFPINIKESYGFLKLFLLYNSVGESITIKFNSPEDRVQFVNAINANYDTDDKRNFSYFLMYYIYELKGGVNFNEKLIVDDVSLFEGNELNAELFYKHVEIYKDNSPKNSQQLQ